jgi:acetolactate synthase I/II/III large subunit
VAKLDVRVATKLDGGEAILEAFRRLGIDYVISSPGSEWAPVWEAFARQKVDGLPGPTYIDCWHETLAVDMAIGYSRVTGRLQAVLLHAGAGLLQGMAGVMAAQHAEVPLIVMSGEALTYGEDPDFEPGQQWFANLSVVGGTHRLVEPLVKWSTQATSVHTLYGMVVRAGEMAQRTPAGPTFLNVPIETMLAPWAPKTKVRDVPPAPITRPPDADIERIADLIVAAERPVITTDSIGRTAEGMAALVELAELMGAPVVDGHSCMYANFPKDNPLYIGFDLHTAAKSADLVLLVQNRVPWYPQRSRPDATVVAIDDSPLKLFMVHQSLQADHYLEGDPASTLRLLSAAIRARKPNVARREERAAGVKRQHDAMVEKLRSAERKVAGAAPIDPIALVAALNDALPDNAVYVDELTVHRNTAQQHLNWNLPQSYFYVNGGLGQGIGLALGVKLAQRDRPVVLMIGDGSFLYNPAMQALGASKENDLPLLIVVFNNTAYEAMRNNHRRYYPEGVAATHDLWLGVHIDGPDYAEFAKPFGLHGERVEDPARLKGALTDALAAVAGGRTAILNVMLSR